MVSGDYERCVGNGPEDQGDHAGELAVYRSHSGATESIRCEAHQERYWARMEELEREQQRKFPGYDVPGSSPPAWFDPAYAGERWDDEY